MSTMPHKFSKSELERILSSVVGKTLGEADINHVFDKTITKPKITGIAGDVIEQSVLGYPGDSDKRPDLDVDGVLTELKTTGVRMPKRHEKGKEDRLEAKEPVSVTAVSIGAIEDEVFENSAFLHKVQHLLFVFYEYESATAVAAAAYAQFHIRKYSFYHFGQDDMKTIRNDWQTVHDFLENIRDTYADPDRRAMEYPKLSSVLNDQLDYLDTAPKYPHPPRFRLRRRVVTMIVRHVFYEQAEESSSRYTGTNDVEKRCRSLAERYKGKTLLEIAKYFGIDTSNMSNKQLKGIPGRVITMMFLDEGKKPMRQSRIPAMLKYGIILKTIALSYKGGRTEDTKFIAADLDALLKEPSFEGDDDAEIPPAEMYSYFHDHKILFAIFRESGPHVYVKGPDGKNIDTYDMRTNIFQGFKLVTFDDELMNDAEKSWVEARSILKDGKLKAIPKTRKDGSVIVNPKGTIRMSVNLPKSEDHIVFFRGTGQDSSDKVVVQGVKMLRQYYWVNGKWLTKRLEGMEYL